MDFHSNAELRLQRRRDVAIAGSALCCLVTATAVPQQSIESGPVVCPFRLATGLPCPGCGLGRAWSALAHGDLDGAFARHAFGPLLFVLAVAAVVVVGYRVLRGFRPVNLAGLAGSRVGASIAAVWCIVWAGAFLL